MGGAGSSGSAASGRAAAPLLFLSALFGLLSAACLVVTIAIGLSLGGSPGPIDFGDPAVLAELAASGERMELVVTLALVAPALGLGAGLGWLYLAGPRHGAARFGVAAWYIGTVLIVAQDAVELAAVQSLPTLGEASRTVSEQFAVLALGRLVADVIAVLTVLGTVIGDLGLLLLSWCVTRRPDRWRLLGWVGIGAAMLRLIGLLVPALAPLRLPGFFLLIVWVLGASIAMLIEARAALRD